MRSYDVIRKYSVIDGRLLSDKPQPEIVIHQENLEKYYGAKIDHMDFRCSDYFDNYESCSYITNIFDRSKLYDSHIESRKHGKHLTIYSPFTEITSVANEIALYMLIEHHVLTLHAVGCSIGDKLIVFLGQSNSGKTTSAMFFKQMMPEARIISDDFLCIRQGKNGLEFTVPIWDILSNCFIQEQWHCAKSIFAVDLSNEHIIKCFSDLANFTIGMDFCPDIAFLIYKELLKIKDNSPNAHFINPNEQNLWFVAQEVINKVCSEK